MIKHWLNFNFDTTAFNKIKPKKVFAIFVVIILNKNGCVLFQISL